MVTMAVLVHAGAMDDEGFDRGEFLDEMRQVLDADLIARLRKDLSVFGIMTVMIAPPPRCTCSWERSEVYREIWMRTKKRTLCPEHRGS